MMASASLTEPLLDPGSAAPASRKHSLAKGQPLSEGDRRWPWFADMATAR
jgi:hypothetical protein